MSRLDKENLAFGDCGFRNVDCGFAMRGDWEMGDKEMGDKESGRHLEPGTRHPELGTRHLAPGTWNIEHRTLNSVSINKFPYWEICITFVNKNSAGYCKKHVKGLLGNPSGL
jgi:hypothetical protein